MVGATQKNFVDLPEFDTGRSGDCFWFQSRMVRSVGNIAASCDNGFAYFHRGDVTSPATDNGASQLSYDALANALPTALGLRTGVNPDDAPVRSFLDNEAFACNAGLFIVKANPHQGHDVHSHLKKLTAWSVRTGADIEYTSHYILENFDLIGRNKGLYGATSRAGIHIGNNAGDIVIVDAVIDNFGTGIHFRYADNDPPDPVHYDRTYVVLNAQFTNVNDNFDGLNTSHDMVLTTAETVPGRFSIMFDQTSPQYYEGYPDPSARIVNVTGVKSDGISVVRIPPLGDTGRDNYNAAIAEVIQLLETEGYYQNGGKNYFCLPDYYTDRLSGTVHKIGRFIEIGSSVQLGSQHFNYRNAVNKGSIILPNGAPITNDEATSTTVNEDIRIDLIANDHDPDGDAIVVDGLLQPNYGIVFNAKNGSVIYRPDWNFVGTDVFRYWVSDHHCNFVPAQVTVTVSLSPTNPTNSGSESTGPESIGSKSNGPAPISSYSPNTAVDTPMSAAVCLSWSLHPLIVVLLLFIL